ncbi:MAG: hypothetical protein H6878_08325 [Rhodobiaceae bacterium]|nr:hypothetical protein [Rhodobiaceae bacterium]MCC0016263.1 hypothetical protein [Rhodobiaceae bacterium]MCC0041646.1 hypothetical protein [Rhodobiaceae bacterium]MCC0052605.1 hypothetical protein [Rhodobiaceae bacterium]
MNILVFQTLLLLLAAFIIGCLLGCWMRRFLAAEEAAEHAIMPSAAKKAPVADTEPVPEPAPPAEPARAEEKPAEKAAATDEKPAEEPAPPAAPVMSAPEPTPEPKPDAPASATAGELIKVEAKGDLRGSQPLGLKSPLGGTADDLKRIRGIGKVNETKLNGLGIWHFDQIAAWGKEQIYWVDDYIAFAGRIEREDWVGQAKVLAIGGETDFSKRVEKGEVPSSEGGAPKKPKG